MEPSAYKNVSLDQALLPGADNPLLPTQNIPNAGLGGLTIVQRATRANPITVNSGTPVDVSVPTGADFLLAHYQFNASPHFQTMVTNNEAGQTIRALYDPDVGVIRFFNDSGVSPVYFTYQLFRIDGKVGSS